MELIKNLKGNFEREKHFHRGHKDIDEGWDARRVIEMGQFWGAQLEIGNRVIEHLGILLKSDSGENLYTSKQYDIYEDLEMFYAGKFVKF